MARQRKRRGISFGTILMLCITVVVLLGFAVVFPRLGSNRDVIVDTGKALQALSLGELLPELTLGDIPISQANTQQPMTTLEPLPQPAQENPSAPVVFAPVNQAAEPTASPAPTAVPGGSFTATFGGSIIIDGDLRQQHYFSEAKKYDFSDVLALLRDELSADFSMVTLENMIYPDIKLSDVNTTADALPMLSRMGVDAVAVGYRNAYNQGMAGLSSTVSAVQATGMTALGAYTSENDAAVAGRIMELGGVKVALLHYVTDALGDKGRNAMKKDGNSFAVATDALSDGADVILRDVAEARKQGAQVVIVSLNGTASSGKASATNKQIAFAQQLADAGVDLIIGAGSRVVQPVTWLTGNLADGSQGKTLCAYSLGTLLNGSRTNSNVAGMLLHLKISYDGQKVVFDQVSYTPTYIWRFKQDGRYYYRVTPSHQPAPDGMSESQVESMERAFTNVKKYLGEDTPLVLR
ncbi:MAG: CapA family protein [Clostridiales bacterium]|nr:CapA family protein [Clostridiales bacterium]